MKRPENWDKAQRALRANHSPRYMRLETFERYVDGTQYDGMPGWHNDSVPLLERAPNVVEPVTQKAILSFVALCLGESRWPTVTVDQSDEDGFGEQLTVGEEVAAIIDRGIANIIDQAQLETVSRRALSQSMGCGTAVGICTVKDGKLSVETPRARWCNPAFDPARPGVVVELEIRYPYLHQYKDGRNNKWAVETLLYRRVITATHDITFKPAKASENGGEPDSWSVQSSIEHGLGFCPVVWYAFDRATATVDEIDGHPIHENLLDEIDCLNRSLSQHDRAALYAGDPQPVEIGVDEDHNPAPTGRLAQPMRHYSGESPPVKESNAKWNMGGSTAVAAGVRKKGPGIVWRYPSKDSKVSFLALPSGALDAIKQNYDDLRNQLAEALSWVRVDPGTMSGSSAGAFNLSGRALQWMYRRQTDRCDTIRPDFEHGFLLPALNQLLRICLSVARGGDGGLYLAGLPSLAAALIPFERGVERDGELVGTRWFSPPIEVKWGPYFEDTALDVAQVGKEVREDYGAGLITKETAVTRLADFYDIESPAEYVRQMEETENHHAESWEQALEALSGTTPEERSGEGPAKELGNNGAGRSSTTASAVLGDQ